jgi:uncharacterized membrane protein YjgN (DUF898 family)
MSQYAAPPPPYQPPPTHPQASTVLVLGILGLTLCGLCAPFAWVMGNRVIAEIDASNGAMVGRDNANIGRICGIVGSVIIILAVVLVVGVFATAGLATVGSTS